MNHRYSSFPIKYGGFQDIRDIHWRATNSGIVNELDEIESEWFEDEDGEIIPLADYLARRE
ncbi:hypothetical protein [Pseudanabaena sp. 'Roaring Creek']|uniref:hypothetical protein n=1 Tax=Pseudanabaena sp. 'Roaring Creek' TaxID=1681830 RepID=UPI0006D7CE37|nr:hypothetical protein [Pseudanabaena sp. 'Roaring Creek']